MNDFNTVSNLVDLLTFRREGSGGIFFVKSREQEEFLSYFDLYKKSTQVLAHLQEEGMSKGDQLILQLQDNKEFIILFWACILGGIIPVPISVGKKDEHKRKFFSVFETLNNPRVVVEEGELDRVREFANTHQLKNTFDRIESDAISMQSILAPHDKFDIQVPDANDIAFIQFSSGSTGDPKGVILTHENILENIATSKRCSMHQSNDKMLSWMPEQPFLEMLLHLM